MVVYASSSEIQLIGTRRSRPPPPPLFLLTFCFALCFCSLLAFVTREPRLPAIASIIYVRGFRFDSNLFLFSCFFFYMFSFLLPFLSFFFCSFSWNRVKRRYLVEPVPDPRDAVGSRLSRVLFIGRCALSRRVPSVCLGRANCSRALLVFFFSFFFAQPEIFVCLFRFVSNVNNVVRRCPERRPAYQVRS